MNPIIEFLGTNLGSHSIKKWALVMGILSASFSLSLMAEEQYKSLNVDLRIMAGQDSYVFRCTATNNSTNNISIPLASGFMADANIFLYNSLGDVDRQLMHTGVAVSWDPDNLPDPLMISGNSLYKEYLDKDTFLLFSGYPTNTYLSLVWGVGKQAKPLVSRVINPLLYCRDLVYYAA